VTTWKEQLGKQIRAARSRKGLTQEEFQASLERAGLRMSLTTLKAYESGKWAPDFGALRLIAYALDTDYFEIDHNIRVDFSTNGKLRLESLPQQLNLEMDATGRINLRCQKSGIGAITKIRA
jgi:transcriptional regulator with XRE-family HTH domain